MAPTLRLSSIGQVTCGIKDAPQIGLADGYIFVIKVSIGQLRDNLFLHRLAGNQRLDFHFRNLCGIFQDVPDN